MRTRLALCLFMVSACGSAVVAQPQQGGAASDGADGGSTATGARNAGGANAGGPPDSASGGDGNGVVDALRQCEAAWDCILVDLNCCGTCGPTELGDFTAINVNSQDAYQASRGCENVPCEACSMSPWRDPNTIALCENSLCVARDLRETDLASCKVASDCELRWGTSCCPCGGDRANVVSVNKTFNVVACETVCTCPGPEFPLGMRAGCNGSHCDITVDTHEAR